jgi:sodium-dependent dicarboxylate transporter 2/3/5
MRQTAGLFVGAAGFVLLLLLPTPEGLTPAAQRAAAVTVLMAAWWMSEAIPIAATAFVPVALFPLLGVLDAKTTAVNYGHNYVLMFLAGFFIARAFEVHNLHRRIALSLIRRIGTSRRRIVLSFMIATALLSMWIANVAVTLLMLPIGIAVASQDEEEGVGADRFGLVLMLAIAYSASIGGTGSLVGTPPNMVFVGMVKTLYPSAPDFAFVDWMQIGLPFVVVLLPITWLYLTRSFGVQGRFEGSERMIAGQLEALGPMSTGERRVLAIFVLTGLGWIFRRDLTIGGFTVPGWAATLGIGDHVHDATVAVTAATLLFLLPSGQPGKRLLDWEAAQTVPWGVAMIVGGGYAIAKSFAATGLAAWLGQELSFISALPLPLIVLLVVLFMTFLTEINSNTATASIFLPVLATMATAGKIHPFLLMVPATFACSCAFMLPSGTGPNAVIFGSGRVTIPAMSRAGLRMNFISVAVLSMVMVLFAMPLLGIDTTPPAWALP